MPQLKVLLGDKELVSTSVPCGKSVYFGPDNVRIIPNREDEFNQNYQQVDNPLLNHSYYYYDDNDEIKFGPYVLYVNGSSHPYAMYKNNGDQRPAFRNDLADKLYIKKSRGGKRKSRKSRKSIRTRRINKRRKRSTKRRRH